MGPDFSFMDDRVQCHANLMRLAMKQTAASEHEVALFLSVRNMCNKGRILECVKQDAKRGICCGGRCKVN
jgi:hypothetical protein